MSDLKSRKVSIKFVPATDDNRVKPWQWHLIFGVVFPAGVIVTELTTRLCAETFFDPIPTIWHVLAVSAVPVVNLLVWTHLRNGSVVPPGWLAFANGAAIAIASFYALLFLPLMPLAVVAILAYGLGLLPFGPLASLVSAIALRKVYRLQYPEKSYGKPLIAGLASGTFLLIALDIPPALTRVGVEMAASEDPVRRGEGVALLRSVGDEDYLLRICYEARTPPSGLLTWVVTVLHRGLIKSNPTLFSSPVEAREIYYRVYGKPFNLKPAPYTGGNWSRFSGFTADSDLGGTEVGGRVFGLNLVSSRIDGSISAADAVAYLEWVVEFRNSSGVQREARMELALPPGGVVSRATLWVNGEEREAAYGGRREVRAAYQRVAVIQRRDPLLVTTKGAGRVLAQAFPVPANGVIKFKIGITAPLDLHEPGKAELVLPAIVDRNFSFADEVSHNLWLESKTPLTAGNGSLKATSPGANPYRVEGRIKDKTLARNREVISAVRNADSGVRVARLDSGEIIRQEVTRSPSNAPGALIVVIDGSARLAAKREELIKALDAIPENVRVGITIAREPPLALTLAHWSATQKKRAIALIEGPRFIGGQDNAPALSDALLALEGEPNAMLLWVHGPQPVRFSGSGSRLEQLSSRLSHFPDVVLYGTEPGPNQVLPDTPWAWGARSLPQIGTVGVDLTGFLGRTFDPGETNTIQRAQFPSADGLAEGSAHIARLWASDRVLTLMRENSVENRIAASRLATRYRLVTPVSGAVVLETLQQYRDSGLNPAGQSTLPTVPEPHEWALLIIACLTLLWLGWRHRQQFVPVR